MQETNNVIAVERGAGSLEHSGRGRQGDFIVCCLVALGF